MWSKFTEYAEGIVEIVAQADAAAAAAAGVADEHDTLNENGDASSLAQSRPLSTSPKAGLSGEEIWSRFTSIVAPPSPSPSGGAPLSQKSARCSDGHARIDATTAPRSAPPSLDQLRAAATAASSSQQLPQPSTSNPPPRTTDENEQERYIYELERALLQRKKQNEALEKQLYEREFQHNQALDTAQRRIAQCTSDANNRIAALTREHEKHHQLIESESESDTALHTQVARLEQQLHQLNTRCSNVQATLNATHCPTPTTHDAFQQPVAAWVAALQSIAHSLVAALESVDDSSSSSDKTPCERTAAPPSVDLLLASIASLADRVRSVLPIESQRRASLVQTIAAFVAQQHDVDASNQTVEQQLECVSRCFKNQIERAVADSKRLEHKLLALQDADETHVKQLLYLQAQLAQFHTTNATNDGCSTTIDAKDATIHQLEAQLHQVTKSMEHLGSELKDAQSYADELEDFCRREKHELATMHAHVVAIELERDALHQQIEAASNRTMELEQQNHALQTEIAIFQQQHDRESQLLSAQSHAAHAASSERQVVYELHARVAASDADKAVAMQDALRLQANVDALERVLLQFQTDSKQQRERLLRLEAALAAAEAQLSDAQLQQQTTTADVDSSSPNDLKRVIDKLATKTLECEQLREALETTAMRYTNDSDVLDRRLAAQLVVAYVATEKKRDVLQLMARMMSFSEDQQRRVGLGYPVDGNGGGGLFSSLLGFVAPPSTADGNETTAVDIDGKSFTEIWTAFLLDEAAKK